MASGFYISRPQSYNEEELENDMGYSARSRTFMRGGEGGRERQNFCSTNTHFVCALVLQSKEKVILKKEITFQ